MTKWNQIERDLSLSAGRPASDREMHKRFLSENGLTQWAHFSPGWDDLAYILRRGCFPRGNKRRPDDGYPRPPYIDHARLYRGCGTPMLVYHPYFPPDEIRSEVEAWAAEQDLAAMVCDSAKSWYYPGETALVIVTAPGVEVAV